MLTDTAKSHFKNLYWTIPFLYYIFVSMYTIIYYTLYVLFCDGIVLGVCLLYMYTKGKLYPSETVLQKFRYYRSLD